MRNSEDVAGERQSLTLADNRVLGFAEYGDPAGEPIFYFHGWPGSRLEARLFTAVACALGVRVIAADRPGYGLSSNLPSRMLSGWSNDVGKIADSLGINRFAALGVSGGGPLRIGLCGTASRARESGKPRRDDRPAH